MDPYHLNEEYLPVIAGLLHQDAMPTLARLISGKSGLFKTKTSPGLWGGESVHVFVRPQRPSGPMVFQGTGELGTEIGHSALTVCGEQKIS